MNDYGNNLDDGSLADNQQQPASSLPRYTVDVEHAVELFSRSGFRIAKRTLTSHCRSNLLDCEKFINGKVTKWKITQESIDKRIETLKREGDPLASYSPLQPVELPAGNSEQKPAEAGGSMKEIMGVLKDELKEKNKQISEYQSIIHTQNKQFENLNETIQISNQTIQQLNKTLALPQIKDYVKSTREINTTDYQYEVPKRNTSDDEDLKNSESNIYPDKHNNH